MKANHEKVSCRARDNLGIAIKCMRSAGLARGLLPRPTRRIALFLYASAMFRPAPAPADIIDRPSSIVAPIRNPPSRLERVGLVAELDVAARPRARVWVASQVNPANFL